jgi:signal transduction histidine kinase
VRTRLLVILLALMAGTLAALGIPLARSVADSRRQAVYLDRLADTARFAGIAGQKPAGDNSELAGELTRYHEVYGISAAIVDRNMSVRVASRPDFRLDDPEVRTYLAGALRGRRGGRPAPIWPWENRPLVVVEPVLAGGDVVAAALTVSPTERLRTQVFRWWLLLAAVELAAVLACVLAAIRLSRWVLRPVHDLDQVAHEIATGRLSARVSARAGPSELRRLTCSFNEMAGHVEDAMSQQRAFVADASHQLRNPLSALLLRIESIGLGLSSEWLDELEETRAEGRRLARVLDELLALARAEHHPARPETVDVRAAVDERVAAWGPVAAARRITFRVAGPAGAPGYIDESALDGVLDAVLDNALKFSPPDSAVTVEVEHGDGGVHVRIRDWGPGVAPEELADIGRRFWRSGRNVNVDGSGLGLSIAAALLAASAGDIGFALGRPGLVVTIRVPAAPAGAGGLGSPGGAGAAGGSGTAAAGRSPDVAAPEAADPDAAASEAASDVAAQA